MALLVRRKRVIFSEWFSKVWWCPSDDSREGEARVGERGGIEWLPSITNDSRRADFRDFTWASSTGSPVPNPLGFPHLPLSDATDSCYCYCMIRPTSYFNSPLSMRDKRFLYTDVHINALYVDIHIDAGAHTHTYTKLKQFRLRT